MMYGMSVICQFVRMSWYSMIEKGGIHFGNDGRFRQANVKRF